jgi:hypothetical protein
MPDTDRQAIAIRLEVLQAKRTICLERLAREDIWSNEYLADHERGLLEALERVILDLMMERQAAG